VRVRQIFAGQSSRSLRDCQTDEDQTELFTRGSGRHVGPVFSAEVGTRGEGDRVLSESSVRTGAVDGGAAADAREAQEAGRRSADSNQSGHGGC